MVRVLGVDDGRTLVVESAGETVTVKLAGIVLTDDGGARALLEWTLVSHWVMLEPQPDGGVFVYRSPDALFVNRELVARGFARATLPSIEQQQHVVVTYLGTLSPYDPGPPLTRAAPRKAAPKTPAVRGNGSGTTRPSPARPSRPRRRPKP
jgi:hypothetical protein